MSTTPTETEKLTEVVASLHETAKHLFASLQLIAGKVDEFERRLEELEKKQ